MARTRRPIIEGWVCQLADHRLEIFLKIERIGNGVPDRKIRASGPREEMEELIAWFEQKTALSVTVPWKTSVKPIPGQTTLLLGDVPEGEQPDEELSSSDTVGDDAR